MRTDIGAAITLDTVFGNPLRDFRSHISSFMSGSSGRNGAIHIRQKGRHREVVSFLTGNVLLQIYHIVQGLLSVGTHLSVQRLVFGISPALRIVNLRYITDTPVNGLEIHLHHIISLFPIAEFCGFFHQTNSFFYRQNIGYPEKGCLQNGTDFVVQSDFLADADSVYNIKMNIVFCNITLYLSG